MAISRPSRTPALEFLRDNIIVGRARAHLSQGELAKRASVSRPTISKIECGIADPGVAVVQRIADVLGVTVADLFVPIRGGVVDDVELARRAAAPEDAFIDADALLEAVDEAAGRIVVTQEPITRYSRAGRPAVAR